MNHVLPPNVNLGYVIPLQTAYVTLSSTLFVDVYEWKILGIFSTSFVDQCL